MENTSVLSLIQNITILLAIVLLFDLNIKRLMSVKFMPVQILSGVVIGCIGIILFLTPWNIMQGIIIDTRSILLPISGLFFGTIPTTIAMIIMVAYRFHLGGDGLLPGILLIFSSGITGIVWRHARKKSLLDISTKEMFFLGLTVQFFMLLWTFFFPSDIATTVFHKILPPLILLFPIGTCLIGQVMVNHLKREKLTNDLIDEDIRLRTLLDVLQYQSNDLDQLFDYTLKKVCKITNSQNIFLFQVDDETLTLLIKEIDSQFDPETQLSDLNKLAIHKLAVEIKKPIFINAKKISPQLIQEKISTDRLMNYYMAIPYWDADKIKAVIVLNNQTTPYTETEKLHTALFLDAMWKIIMRHSAEQALMSIEWMLTKKKTGETKDHLFISKDELTTINKDGIIINTIDHQLLQDIAYEYLDLLDTSFAIVEKNGNYALAIYSSTWCKFMNDASCMLSTSPNVKEAMDSGKWLCHESRWTQAANKSIELNEAVDIACIGGLNIYCVPITTTSGVIGTISFGYGNPPKGKTAIKKIAEQYKIDPEVLYELADSYKSRPPFIVELAKQRLKSSANVIALLVELELTQRELRKNEEMQNKIIDLLPVGLWFADKEGTLYRTNAAGAQIWGAEQKVRIDEYSVFKARHYPSMEEITGENWALYHTINEGTTTENELLEIDTFDGKKKIILNFSTPILSDSNDIEGAIVVNLDVTDRIKAQNEARSAQQELERLLNDADQARQVLLSVIEDQKIAEEKIQQLNEELEQRIKDRTAQLEVANRELEAFAYSVSHDLRAPLRAMDGFSAALLEDYPDTLDHQAKHYLARIQQASQRMGQLIEDLLHLSRVTRREINFQQIDLSLIANDISRELQVQYKDRNIKFKIQQPLSVTADAHLIRIALQNLMNNAVKFSGTKKQAKIEIGVLQNENEKIYYVKDNGVGFNMKYSDKLFSPFQRLHSMDEFPGTGIGLVTVQRIINRHGGKIWPEAQLNKGATFYFTLGG